MTTMHFVILGAAILLLATVTLAYVFANVLARDSDRHADDFFDFGDSRMDER